LLRTRELSCGTGADFMVLSIPQLYPVIAATREGPDGARHAGHLDRVFAARAREHGFPWLPALEALVRAARRDGDELYHRLDGHLTALGNRVVGTLLADEFVARYAERPDGSSLRAGGKPADPGDGAGPAR